MHLDLAGGMSGVTLFACYGLVAAAAHHIQPGCGFGTLSNNITCIEIPDSGFAGFFAQIFDLVYTDGEFEYVH